MSDQTPESFVAMTLTGKYLLMHNSTGFGDLKVVSETGNLQHATVFSMRVMNGRVSPLEPKSAAKLRNCNLIPAKETRSVELLLMEKK